jgi:hypothetical protein
MPCGTTWISAGSDSVEGEQLRKVEEVNVRSTMTKDRIRRTENRGQKTDNLTSDF